MRLDGPAIRAGVVADLAVMAPVVGLYAAVRGTGIVSGDGPVIATAVLAGLLAPLVGGTVAGTRGRDAPLTNGAVAAGIAAAGFIVFRLVDAVVRGVGVHAGSVITLTLVAMTLGLLGGYAGFRFTGQTQRP